MRKHRLNILAALSLTAIGLLLAGYFLTYGLEVSRTCVRESKTWLMQWMIELDRGRFWFQHTSCIPNNPKLKFPAPPSLDFDLVFERDWAGLSQSLWEFEARQDDVPGLWSTTLVFPLWCLALPCMIA